MQEIDIEIGLSKIFRAAWFLLVLLTYFIALTLVMAFPLTVLLIIGLSVYLLHIYQQHIALSSKTAIKNLTYQQEWRLHGHAVTRTATLLGSSTITPYALVLNFKMGKIKQAVIIFKDAISQQDFRRLTVIIKTNHARAAELKRKKKTYRLNEEVARG